MPASRSSRALFGSLTAALVAVGLLAPPARAQEADLGTFNDVGFDHWAFLTVEMLVRKYNAMAGFPDGTFRGDRMVTRYELAAALEKVLDRMEAMRRGGQGVPAADQKIVAEAVSTYDLKDLKGRVDTLLRDTQALADDTLKSRVAIAGYSSTTWMDNTQDTVAPYFSTGLSLDLAADVSDTMKVYAGMSGSVPGSVTGNKPGPAGGGKPPTGDWRFNGAHVTAKVAGFQVRSGLFSPAGLYRTGTSLPFSWGGLVGNGFIYPNVNTVRWGDQSVAVAATREFGPLTATASVSPTVMLLGFNWRPSDWLNLRLSGDMDQPNWSQLIGGTGTTTTATQAIATNTFAVVDVGGENLGVSFQGGFNKNLAQASLAATWVPWGSLRVAAGAIVRNSDKTTELTPGATVYVPSLVNWMPALTFAVKEPQILSSSEGKTGPGSLLGEYAGFTTFAAWDLSPWGLPSLKAEYNIQQPVLFYKIYDATFALNVGRGF